MQLSLLYTLYLSVENETKQNIYANIERADQLYLSNRFEESMEKNNYQTPLVFDNIKDSISSKAISELSKSKQLSNVVIADISDDKGVNFLEKVSGGVKYGLHEMLDQTSPVDLALLNQLIDSILTSKHINVFTQYSELIDVESNQIISTSKNEIKERGEVFEYRHSPNSKYLYRIHTTPLTRNVLGQIAGILATSFSIFIVISLAIWYLVKIVLRQKTLEEIKEDFVNNMTHELKTPVSVAYSATDAVLNYPELDVNKRNKYLRIATLQLKKIGDLIEQILSSSMEQSKGVQIQKESVVLKDLLVSLKSQYELTAPKNCSISINIQTDDLSIYADKSHLNNSLSNLIDNSIKYSGNSVAINISISEEDRNVVIKVEDNGNGIPKDKIKYVFDKFYRVSEGKIHETKGYGLGLYYVKEIVEKHSGVITVDSTVGKGSCFTIKLPQSIYG